MGLYFPPTKNAIQKTLTAQLLAGGTTANLSDVDGIADRPGIAVIDRVDSNGVATPSQREYVSYTGISGSTITGLTRNVDNGGTDQNHAVGAIVEFVPDVMWANEINKALTSVVNISSASYTISPNILTTSTVTLSNKVFVNATFSGGVNFSGASLSGILAPIHPTWFLAGYSSGPTTSIGMPVDMPQKGTIEFASMTLRSPISGASLVVDILKNGTSIFATTSRLSILGGGTYSSTASIATATFNAGDVFRVDLINGGWYADLNVKFRAKP